MEIGKEESRTTERRGRNEICFLPYLCGRTLFSLSGCFSLAFSSWMLSFPSCQKETLTHQLHQRKTPVSLLPHCKGRIGTAILGYCSAPPWHRGVSGPQSPLGAALPAFLQQCTEGTVPLRDGWGSHDLLLPETVTSSYLQNRG